MEIVHQNTPYQDRVREITEEERRHPEFEWTEANINDLYRQMGATVVGGVSYSGERPGVAFFIHAKQSADMAAFENRPA